MEKNQNKPDDRSDNVERIQKNINYTIKNMEAADELIEKTDSEKTKATLLDKNKRRRSALEKMRFEIADEARAREQDYEGEYDLQEDPETEY